MTDQTQVTDADREAAAQLIEAYWSGADASMMKLAASYRDGHSQGAFVRAFAHHRATAYAAGVAAERERLAPMLVPQWFYLDDDQSSDRCRFSVHEVIDEDFLAWGEHKTGKHVVKITTAMPGPTIWAAVHFLTPEEKDALETDDTYLLIEYETEEEALSAIEAYGIAAGEGEA